MPTLVPGPLPARQTRGARCETLCCELGTRPLFGGCDECAALNGGAAGASDTLSSVRHGHCGDPWAPQAASGKCACPPSKPGPVRPGRGRAGRRGRRALTRAVARGRARAYGRKRAQHRVASGRWDPHPGWRNRIDGDFAVLTDQTAALRRIEQLVDAELWREDKRTRWTRILRRLAHSMDWTTGLVCGVTLAQLANVGGCSPRTVSRLLAWAQEADLLVVVEVGAAGAFLGTATNRAPAYVLVAPSATPGDQPPVGSEAGSCTAVKEFGELRPDVDESGDLPHSYGGFKPLINGKHRRQPPNTNWPLWQIPGTSSERSAAVTTLLSKIGLDHRNTTVWRARGLLHQWWDAGACVAGLLYAIDHDPDGNPRGDALRGAVDPLRVLGYRLRPWVGQLHRVPSHFAGRHGDYRATQAARIARGIATAELNRVRRANDQTLPVSTAAGRDAARTALKAALANRARARQATSATAQTSSPSRRHSPLT